MNPNPSFNPSPNRNPKPNRHPDPNPSPNPSPNHCPYLTLPLPGPLMLPALMLPALPFTILMPALSLLLVFRTNTGYARWNEVSESDAVMLTLLLTGRGLRGGACNPMHPGCNPMHPGAHAMGRPHQQLPQRCAPERHESATLIPCFPCSPACPMC